MKRRTLPKSNKKYVVLGLLAVLFLSLFFLSFQKKREGMSNRRKNKGEKKDIEKKKKIENDSTEDILRDKIENFKQKLENMRNEKKELEGKNEELKEGMEKAKSDLKNEQDINRVKIKF